MIENAFRYVGGGLAPVLPQLPVALNEQEVTRRRRCADHLSVTARAKVLLFFDGVFYAQGRDSLSLVAPR